MKTEVSIPIYQVIDLQTQLGYFKNVSRVLRKELGDAKAEALLSRAVYLFSVGTNDYAFPFETNSSVLYTYSVEQYVGQEIYEVGGRKFGFPNLGPIECAPFSRTMVPAGENKCFEPFTPYVELHNIEISKLFQELQNHLKGVKYSILDFRAVGQDLINYPSKYGFKEGKVACCGSGPYSVIFFFFYKKIFPVTPSRTWKDAALFGPLKNHVALFIFGDSLFDAGNNNYINTTLKANYKPYGETFFHYPTGRFSDGRLIPDFIAEYAKLPLIPPYLQPGIDHQLTNGVNFASSGAGALVETRQGLVSYIYIAYTWYRFLGFFFCPFMYNG
ncbi:hypothetical protein FEM48_Zijuj01G0261800 [Ziziphus jujuba var. spinosa]|uniref:GDSL esterase/lipase 1-like n=1 Tax=Ziziphus jujuba var. spinosa TaxID=714518 RepID=A0A978W4X8_ZIZJJ|nr:hypothetical protein FEM48_Zijuj01G0261800 [Ziziphus jujuba var. spinosa]